jgi:hypothetical protein
VPLTRLIVGTRFALGLARVAPAVARELGVPRRRRVPLPLLLAAGGLGALLGLATTLGVFGALLGAVLSLAGGLAVVVVVFLVMDSIARDLRRGGRRRGAGAGAHARMISSRRRAGRPSRSAGRP